MTKVLFSILLILLVFVTHQVSSENHVWRDPTDWRRDGAADITDKTRTCSDRDLPLCYYKRLVNMLFRSEKVDCDFTSSGCQRSINFVITHSELEKLQKFEDIRDADAILTAIFRRSQPVKMFKSACYMPYITYITSSVASYFNILKDTVTTAIEMREVTFTLIAILVFLVGYNIKQRFRIALFTFVVTSALSFGYYITYLECNRKLEVDGILRKMREYEASRPPKYAWYNVFAWFYTDNTGKIHYEQVLRNSIKIDLPYCRPDVVFMMYSNEFLFKYITAVLETYTTVVKQLNNDLPFPLNVLSPLVVMVMFSFLIKLIFKYILSPIAWAPLTAVPQLRNGCTCQAIKAAPTRNIDISNEDRDLLSGESVRTLLDTIRTIATITKRLERANSKVEEVKFETNAEPSESVEYQKEVREVLISSEKTITPQTFEIEDLSDQPEMETDDSFGIEQMRSSNAEDFSMKSAETKFYSGNLKGKSKEHKKLIIDNCFHIEETRSAAGGCVAKNHKMSDETEIEEVNLNGSQVSQEQTQNIQDNFIDVDNTIGNSVEFDSDSDFDILDFD